MFQNLTTEEEMKKSISCFASSVGRMSSKNAYPRSSYLGYDFLVFTFFVCHSAHLWIAMRFFNKL